MLKFLLVVVILFAVALGLHALSQVTGEATLTIGDTVYAVDLTIAVLGAVALVLVALGLLWFLRALLRAPWRIARGGAPANAVAKRCRMGWSRSRPEMSARRSALCSKRRGGRLASR
jgi:uncharacterized membrane-anchored protein